MRFHKEGRFIITLSSILVLLFLLPLWLFLAAWLWVALSLSFIILVCWVLILQFFRNPPRPLPQEDKNLVYAPADGQLVVLEETEEQEILGQKYLQLSIFMSPLNVHVNRHPVSGRIGYYRYHQGRFFMAWNPKASTDNERSTVLYELDNGKKVLLRQIAGFLARRIICYAQEGAEAVQGEDMGFIRFGSRVDVFLPLDAEVLVKIGDKIIGNKTVLARI